MIVADAGNNRLSVFTTEGKFVRTIGRKGSGPGEFVGPRGVAVILCPDARSPNT